MVSGWQQWAIAAVVDSSADLGLARQDARHEIGAALKRRCEVAGVFVDSTMDEIVRAAADEQLTIVQLHGDQGPRFCREVARRTGAKVMRAFRVFFPLASKRGARVVPRSRS